MKNRMSIVVAVGLALAACNASAKVVVDPKYQSPNAGGGRGFTCKLRPGEFEAKLKVSRKLVVAPSGKGNILESRIRYADLRGCKGLTVPAGVNRVVLQDALLYQTQLVLWGASLALPNSAVYYSTIDSGYAHHVEQVDLRGTYLFSTYLSFASIGGERFSYPGLDLRGTVWDGGGLRVGDYPSNSPDIVVGKVTVTQGDSSTYLTRLRWINAAFMDFNMPRSTIRFNNFSYYGRFPFGITKSANLTGAKLLYNQFDYTDVTTLVPALRGAAVVRYNTSAYAYTKADSKAPKKFFPKINK